MVIIVIVIITTMVMVIHCTIMRNRNINQTLRNELDCGLGDVDIKEICTAVFRSNNERGLIRTIFRPNKKLKPLKTLIFTNILQWAICTNNHLGARDLLLVGGVGVGKGCGVV